jgi:DNA-binding beta-propeller fold protein YncE
MSKECRVERQATALPQTHIDRRLFLQGSLGLLALAACEVSSDPASDFETAPAPLAWDPAGNAFELGPHRLSKLGAWSFGEFGVEAHQLNGPCAVAATAQRVYVADRGNHRVAVLDAATGKLLGHIGAGAEPGASLLGPRDVLVDAAAQRLWVADTLHNRVQAYDLDGRHLGSFGGLTEDAQRVNAPVALALDAQRRLHVLDRAERRVQVFDAQGRHVRAYGSPQWLAPSSLALDLQGRAYVADPVDGAVHLLDAQGAFVRRVVPATNGASPRKVFLDPTGKPYLYATQT